MSPFRIGLWLAVAYVASACAGSVPERLRETPWVPCGGGHECAVLELPLDWEAPDDAVKRIAARRLLAVEDGARQVWILPGGPGFSGIAGLSRLMDDLHFLLPRADLYTLDPHGVGASGHLSCDRSEDPESPGGRSIVADEVPGCVEHLANRLQGGLTSYGLTASAHDLASFIHATREPSKRVVVVASSAATVWAQRLLLLYPDLLDAVVLEAFLPPGFSSKTIDATAENAFSALLETCATDPACAERFPQAATRVRQLWPALEAGHCAALRTTVPELQTRVFHLLGTFPWNTLVPALLFRAERCTAEDAAFVRAVLALNDRQTPNGSPPRFSRVLFQLVTASELWSHPQWETEEAYRDGLRVLTENSLLGNGAGGITTSEALQAWPRYRDPLGSLWPSVDVPMMIFQGGIDPRVSPTISMKARQYYSGPDQVYLLFPSATHNVIGGTPTARGDCAVRLMVEFVETLEAPRDLRCLDEVLAPDFGGRTWGESLIGTSDYWNAGGGVAEMMGETAASEGPTLRMSMTMAAE